MRARPFPLRLNPKVLNRSIPGHTGRHKGLTVVLSGRVIVTSTVEWKEVFAAESSQLKDTLFTACFGALKTLHKSAKTVDIPRLMY
jgi:hypothetical protein